METRYLLSLYKTYHIGSIPKDDYSFQTMF